MRCFQIISTILGFAMLSAALPQALPYRSVALSRRHVAIKHAVSDIDALALKDFELSGFLSTSIPDSSNTSFNRSLNCTFDYTNSQKLFTDAFKSPSWIPTLIPRPRALTPGSILPTPLVLPSVLPT